FPSPRSCYARLPPPLSASLQSRPGYPSQMSHYRENSSCFCLSVPVIVCIAEILTRQAHLTGCNHTVRPAPIKPMPKMTPEMRKRMSKPLTTNPRIPTTVEVINKAYAGKPFSVLLLTQEERFLLCTDSVVSLSYSCPANEGGC